MRCGHRKKIFFDTQIIGSAYPSRAFQGTWPFMSRQQSASNLVISVQVYPNDMTLRFILNED